MGERERPWYETLFGDAWLERALAIPLERTQKEVEFIATVLELPAGARLLDLACGHGRHALEFARRGYDVTGVDLSQPALEAAYDAAERAGLQLDLHHKDMREIGFDAEFDAAINIFTAFGYFAEEGDDELVLLAVARALRPGGLFLIDVINQPGLMRRYDSKGWDEMGDGTIWIDERRYDARTGRNEVRHLVIRPDGRRQELAHSLRVYTCPELSSLLERAGLSPERVWGDFDGSEYGMDSPRMIVGARKT